MGQQLLSCNDTQADNSKLSNKCFSHYNVLTFNNCLCKFFGLILCSIPCLLITSSETFAGTYCENDQASIPPNEAVVAVTSDSSCGLFAIRLTTKVPSTSSTEEICGNYQFPSGGFVIIEKKDGAPPGIDCTTGTGRGTRYRIRIPDNNSTTDTCQDAKAPVPPGFVVTARDSTSTCGTSTNGVEETIRQPSDNGTTTKICQNSPIPTPYVVTKDNYSATTTCGTNGTQPQWDIQLAANNIWICQTYVLVPDGFSIIGQDNTYSNCSNTLAYQLGVPSHNGIVCGSEQPPAGFVKTEINDYSTCANSLGFKVFEVSQIPSTGLTICGNGAIDVPPGYIVDLVTTSGSCSASSSGNALHIELPSSTQTTPACENYGIPSYFGITSISTSNSCSNIGSGIVYNIEEFNAGALYCDHAQFQLPSGYIIKQVQNNTSTCSTPGTQFEIDLPNPAGQTLICSNNLNDLPAGYVITNAVQNSSICGTFRSLWTIEIPKTDRDTRVCANSPVPSGFLSVQVGITGNQCIGILGDTSQIIRPINFSGPITVCAGSPIPPGYVVTRYEDTSECNLASVPNSYFIEPVDPNGIVVCPNPPIPNYQPVFDDYVILRYVPTTLCGNVSPSAYEIATPNLTGPTTTCSDSMMLPPGFQIISTVQTSECGASPTANIIGPADFQLPGTFVDPINNVVPGNVPTVTYDCGGTPLDAGFINGQPKNNAQCN